MKSAFCQSLWYVDTVHQFCGTISGIRATENRAALRSTAYTTKTMVKKQQMQWTPRGAHLLLQVRTQVLNEDWDDRFRNPNDQSVTPER